MSPHIQILLEAEKNTRGPYGGNIMFCRLSDSVVSVSCTGYNHQDLYDVEASLLQFGCKYDFARGIQTFDKQSGRTYTYFKEPKND